MSHRAYEWNSKRVFISYKFDDSCGICSRDRQIDSAVRAALRQQGLLVRSICLGFGARITPECRAHIDLSDVFVALISRRAMQSQHCVDEICHALSRQKNGILIFPIFIDHESHDEVNRDALLHPYAELNEVICRYARFMSPNQIANDLAVSVCQMLGIDYIEHIDHPDTPLRGRVWSEFSQLLSDPDRKLDSFKTVYNQCCESAAWFHHCYYPSASSAIDLQKARDAVQAVLALGEQLVDRGSMYYPRLLLSILQLDLADAAKCRAERSRFIGNAEEILDGLLGRSQTKSHLPWDESMYLAKGICSWKRGDFDDAITSFQQARDFGDSEEPTILYHLVICTIRCDGTGPDALEQLRLPPSFWNTELPLSVREPADEIRQRLLLCAAFIYTGDERRAVSVFDRLEPARLPGHEHLVHFVAELMWETACRFDIKESNQAKSMRKDAIRILRYSLETPISTSNEARHHLYARLQFELGEYREAETAYTALLSHDPERGIFLLERGLLYEIHRKRGDACRCYKSVLKEKPQEGRYNRDDLLFPAEHFRISREYAIGYAIWRLSRNKKKARHHFNESERKESQWWYPVVDKRIGLKRKYF